MKFKTCLFGKIQIKIESVFRSNELFYDRYDKCTQCNKVQNLTKIKPFFERALAETEDWINPNNSNVHTHTSNFPKITALRCYYLCIHLFISTLKTHLFLDLRRVNMAFT
jgi:hypothetical protein